MLLLQGAQSGIHGSLPLRPRDKGAGIRGTTILGPKLERGPNVTTEALLAYPYPAPLWHGRSTPGTFLPALNTMGRRCWAAARASRHRVREEPGRFKGSRGSGWWCLFSCFPSEPASGRKIVILSAELRPAAALQGFTCIPFSLPPTPPCLTFGFLCCIGCSRQNKKENLLLSLRFTPVFFSFEHSSATELIAVIVLWKAMARVEWGGVTPKVPQTYLAFWFVCLAPTDNPLCCQTDPEWS